MNDQTRLLEEKIAYLERHVTEQDKVIMELVDDLARLRKEMRSWRDRQEVAARPDPGNQPEDDRPPHY